MKIYVVLHNPCIYESAAAPIGYFHSLQSAYHCMRKAILEEYNEKREAVLLYGHWLRRGKKYLDSQWWGISNVEVQA
jgi:hypothetical protein